MSQHLAIAPLPRADTAAMVDRRDTCNIRPMLPTAVTDIYPIRLILQDPESMRIFAVFRYFYFYRQIYMQRS